jgi:hypothetical protein
MKICKLLIIFISTAIFLWPDYILAEKAFISNIQVVEPQSSFNAIRNPALMSFGKGSSIGVAYMYNRLADSKSETDIVLSGTKLNSKVESDQEYDGAVFLSTVYKSDKNSFGFGIARGDDGQMIKNSTGMALYEPMSGLTFLSHEKKENFGTIFNLSYSYRVSPHYSIGLQGEFLVASSSVNRESHVDMLNEHKEVEVERKSVTSGLSVGYFYSGDLIDFGLMIKSGRYGFEEASYKYRDTTASNSKDISSYFINDKSPSGAAGISIKPGEIFSISFSIGASMPYNYNVKECDDDNSSLYEYEKTVKLNYGLASAGALFWKPGSRVLLGAGVSFLIFNQDTESDEIAMNGSEKFSLLRFSTAITLKASRDAEIFAGLNWNDTKGNMESHKNNFDMAIDLSQKSYDFFAGLGLRY